MRRVGLALALVAILAAIAAIQAHAMQTRIARANEELDWLDNRRRDTGWRPKGTPVTNALADGADPNHLSLGGANLLMLAAAYGDRAAMEGAFRAGVDVNSAHRQTGETALHFAAEAGELETVKFLLERGAKREGVGASQWTPLDAAVGEFQLPVVQLLLDRGADPDPEPKRGENSLVHSAITHDGELSHRSDPQVDEKVLELLIVRGVRINHVGHDGKTPLDLARDYGNVQVVDLLKRHGGMAAWRLRREQGVGRKTRP